MKDQVKCSLSSHAEKLDWDPGSQFLLVLIVGKKGRKEESKEEKEKKKEKGRNERCKGKKEGYSSYSYGEKYNVKWLKFHIEKCSTLESIT